MSVSRWPSSRAPLIIVSALMLLFQNVLASSPLSHRNEDDICFTPDRDTTGLDISFPTCAVPGQTDFYGFGVRIGIYLTWISSWLANNFAADEVSGNLDTCSIFLLAVALTVAILSFMESIWIIDSIVLLQLSFGFVLGVMTIWGRRTRYYKQGHFGGWGTHCRLALCLAVCAYSLWFWTRAIVDPDPDCFLREECNGLRTFFWVDLKAMGGIRMFYAVFSGLGCVYYGTMAVVAAVTFVSHLFATDKRSWIPIEHQARVGDDMQGSTKLYLALSIFSLFCVIFTMLVVEFTLNLNHVSGVLANAGIANASQLLPLLIGIFSTLRICWVIYHDKVIERRRRGNAAATERPEQVELGDVQPSSVGPARPQVTDVRDQGEGRAQKWWYQLLSMWLPWLGCHQRWRELGVSTVLSSGTAAASDDRARRGSYSTVKTSLMSVKGYGDGAA